MTSIKCHKWTWQWRTRNWRHAAALVISFLVWFKNNTDNVSECTKLFLTPPSARRPGRPSNLHSLKPALLENTHYYLLKCTCIIWKKNPPMQIYCITLQLHQHWQFSWRQPPLKISDLSAERMEGRQTERYDRISRRRRLALSLPAGLAISDAVKAENLAVVRRISFSR